MDKTAIKNFAVRARNKLIEQVKQKAFEIGIEKDKIVDPQVKGTDSVKIYNRYLDKEEIRQRDRLIDEIDLKGYEQVMEEVSYTWFNRFIALRFMEVKGYLPAGVRVLSSYNKEKVESDIVTDALNSNDLDIDTDVIYKYQDDNDTDGLFKYLLIKQCNSLNDIMPFIFEKIADYTEILLPNNLLREGSVIRDMVNSIDEDNWSEVEIIGWMYQFYISEKKDEVFASKEKVKKEEIPAATQLFTPDWIVKYMVENSLGRYWLESNTNGDLQNKWKYYQKEPEQEPDVQKNLDKIRGKNINPEEITILDPACGSGHILVYAFDVLYDIYKSVGYMESDIPQLILNKNLYGLEICDRAAQLASLSVMMKAREKDSSIFMRDINLNICSIQESNNISNQIITVLIDNINNHKRKSVVQNELIYLRDTFKDAKNYGSIIDVNRVNFDFQEIIENITTDNLFDLSNLNVILRQLPGLIKQAKIMGSKYDIVVTNPPYMGDININDKLKKYIKRKYNSFNDDLFTVFMVKNMKYTKKSGLLGFMTPYVWMYNKGCKTIREKIIESKTLLSLIQLEPSSFKDATVPLCTFILKNMLLKDYFGVFVDLSNFKGASIQSIKTLEAINNHVTYKYIRRQSRFTNITEKPITFTASDKVMDIFKVGNPLDAIASPKAGLSTGDNKYFQKYWHEVNFNKIGFNYRSCEETSDGKYKWFPCNSGGKYRKWYGNNEIVINWENNGMELRNFRTKNGRLRSALRNRDYYFKKGITWTKLSSSKFGVRIKETGYIFDDTGRSAFIDDMKYNNCLLGFLCSNITFKLLKILNPTMSYTNGDLSRLPFLLNEINQHKKSIDNMVKSNIDTSKIDWDSYETSWDFKKHPLLTYKQDAETIKNAFNNSSDFAEKQFYKLKENEEELNRIFIDIYGLQDELTPAVDEDDVTISKADKERDIKSFISYAVGCMLGRYSLDEEGLVYAGGEFDESRYETFKVDKDGIIPILDDEYFDDDIVARFIEFLKVTFGEEHLEENLDYIAETLGRRSRETSRQAIRRYFVTNFIKDHVQTYNKRPIYWLFQSDGRRKAFNALIYMHRYDSGTVARVRTDYLHELQKKIEAEKVRLQGIIDSDLSAREINKARKKFDKLNKDTEELIKYDEVINHIANQQIKIDLDDGVQENYEKFADVLTRI